MGIEKITNINKLLDTKKAKPVSKKQKTGKKDSIEISSEAKNAAEIAKQINIVKETPDIRIDRINSIKERIANGTYDFNDTKILEMVADKIVDALIR